MGSFMGVFFTLSGLAMAIFHKPLGRVAGYFQREVMRVKFVKDDQSATGYLIMGILFVAIGMFMLFVG